MAKQQEGLIVFDSDPVTKKTLESILQLPVHAVNDAEVNSYSQTVAAFVDISDNSPESIKRITELVKSCPDAPVFAVGGQQAAAVGEAFSAGAHDFIRKPFIPAEVRSRFVTRLLNVAELAAENKIFLGDAYFYPTQSQIEACHSGKSITISPCASKLLKTLWSARGIVIEKSCLIGRVWQGESLSVNALDRQLSDLRRAFKDIDSKVCIRSIYNKGVKLILPMESLPNEAA